MFDLPGKISSLELSCEEDKINSVKKNLEEKLGANFIVKNRYELNDVLFKALETEKLATFIILGFILVIATFTTIGTLTMLIIEKRKDIKTLHSMGADLTLIRSIFMREAFLISGIGAFIGLTLGLLICWLQMQFHLVTFGSEFIVPYYPIELQLQDFIWIFALIMFIGFLAALYPIRVFTKNRFGNYLIVEISYINKMKARLILFAFLIFNVWHCLRAQLIQVNAATVIRAFDNNSAGINLDYLMDDDTYLNPTTLLQQSLKNMHVGALRFPGGEKADNYLWSVPPYSGVNPHFATPGNCNWPNNDPAFSSNYLSPLPTAMDFDEFMVVCQQTKARPLIVVAGDAQFNTFCAAAPTLTSLITNAVEWVKYANITHAYKIKNWVIGNESFNSAAYDAPPTASQYAHDVIQFSQAMKAIDPSISVVANAKSGAWIDTLMSVAGAYIDAIAVSNYPVYNWTNGYDAYRTGNPNLVSEINAILSSVTNTNINVIVTEYNSMDWGGFWPDTNNLGHAIVNFQMFGDQMKIKRVENAYLWNTRWINNATSPQHVYDAIDSHGALNATGKALSLWGANMLDKMVFSTNGNYVNSFAVRDSSGDSLNLFLINKDLQPRTATVTISNYPALSQPNFSLTHMRLSGSSPADKFPTITYPTGSVSISGNVLKVNLSPHSINVLQMKHITVLDTTTNPPDTTTVPPTTLTTVGLQKTNQKINKILVYPNPTVGNLSVNFESPLLMEEEIKITNALGVDLYSQKTKTQNNTIDIRDLANGIYFITTKNYRKLIMKTGD